MDFDFTELKAIIEQFVLFFQTFFKTVIAMIGDISHGFAGYPEETTTEEHNLLR